MTLQAKILQYLRSRPDTWVIKVEVANERGCPDILACIAGKFVAIEVKEGKDKASPIQLEQIRRIRAAGGEAWVIKDMDTLVKSIGELE